MELREMIQGQGQIVVDLKAKTQWEAIDELLNAMVGSGKIPAQHLGVVTEAVKKRESSLSTGVGNGIGLPHAVCDIITEVVGSIGLSRRGISFDAVDNKPVSLVVLFLVPRNQAQQHLNTLANIARVLNNQAFRKKIESATTAEEVLQLIQAGKR